MLDAVTDGLAEAFWDESNPAGRRLFLDEALGRSEDAVTFEFDVFAVTLDFDRDIATVDDVLEPGSSETVGLQVFLGRAASFGDDPNLGDDLTAMQRRPARFAVDHTGQVAAADPATGS